MPLGGLVLLEVVHHYLETAVDAAVVEVEAETPDFERLASSFVLPGVYPRTQRLNHLVVPPEQGVLVDRVVALVPLVIVISLH